MGIRTGKQFLESLKDSRDIRIDGERVTDIANDPRFAGAAQTLAELYDLQHDPDLKPRMTFASPSDGVPVGLSHIQPRSGEDLSRRREMIKTWTDATCGMFGRSPDYMNVHVSSFAAAAEEFDKSRAGFGANIRCYHEYVRDTDLAMTHTLVNPQVDRSKPVEKQDKDLAARAVKETDAGILVRGARMVATLCAFADELIVMPSGIVPSSPDAAPYALGFAVPSNTPGLRYVCRPAVVHRDSASPADWPLSSKLDESDGMVVFDDVFVPWERVFIYRDPEFCNGLYGHTVAGPHIMQQATIRSLSKAEFMMALAFTIAKSMNLDVHLHVQGMLSEMIVATELVRACLDAAESQATQTRFGTFAPATLPLWVVRLQFPRLFVRMQEIIQLLGASGLVAVPSYAETASAAQAHVLTYFQAANVDAPSRIKLFRLAFDAAVSSFAGRQQLYERYYAGDPVRLAGALYNLYGKDEHMERIWEMLGKIQGTEEP